MKHHFLKPLFLVASARAKQRTAHFPLAIILLQLSFCALPAAEFHVAVNGSDANSGTRAKPLRTIQRGAELARPSTTTSIPTSPLSALSLGDGTREILTIHIE